jgi:hypothetical protein
LKYSIGAIPGKPLKRKSTEEETLARKRKYELSRERKFLSVWQSGRLWLKYLQDRKVMVCSEWHRCCISTAALYWIIMNLKTPEKFEKLIPNDY